ncbi:DUF2461 domain-containing protein [Sphingobacterium alkalisoli]|uniref:DUF2461 domain-containing protein n=1 Tax=Sphingobacterium alkalisoli TaxID=1874115 RepID=A0A4U0H7V3_9SPHI|nr:DUF2461 domain-containing protein [Sphingobacterium alkalisoli]TJY67890.1 DUF2461 domain-containing protein [Sphingobacterium alkalisoli]GGH10652.1 TIGR02453 family protein [Sphingobacterium alkalisoli]
MLIRSATFSFLRNLKKNNTREWFQEHKEDYDLANQNVKEFIEAMIQRLSEFDLQINTDIKAAKCMFRIYRDIRFSKDKTPYKSWLAAGISIDGRKLDGPEYYIHIESGNNFLAAGYWRPKKEHLDAIRQEIDYNAVEFVNALAAGGWKPEDLSQEDKLVRPPAGYDANDPNIELLKLKSFILYKQFSDEEMQSADALDKVINTCKDIYPFKLFIHQAIDS